MASNVDGDLIDLGNDRCVSRITVNDETLEEQEHLLDVCPPKLEQKLSFTSQRDQVSYNSIENDDILVTLGHDQVMPKRKRIDVVSSDTIKRVRDITRNLEPVMDETVRRSGVNEKIQRDTTDRMSGRMSMNEKRRNSMMRHENLTYETQEINSAFNFLNDHDDNELFTRNETSPGRLTNEHTDSNYVAVRCLTSEEEPGTVTRPFEYGDSNEKATIVDGDLIERPNITSNHRYNLGNSVFESSSDSAGILGENNDSISHGMIVPANMDLEFRIEDTIEQYGRENERRSLFRSESPVDRESSMEETGSNSDSADNLHRIDESVSLKVYQCIPSTSEINPESSSFFTRYILHIRCYRILLFSLFLTRRILLIYVYP